MINRVKTVSAILVIVIGKSVAHCLRNGNLAVVWTPKGDLFHRVCYISKINENVTSRFDDKFSAEICAANNYPLMEIVSESVNSSIWYKANGIDFDGGDSTVYHTGWKTVNIDVREWSGKVIILKFSVTDVGDSAFDSDVLIDNVVVR